MLKIFGVIVFLLAGIASYWAYLGFFKPVAPVPEVAIELAAHFVKQGIEVTPSSIRHGFSDVEAAIEYTFSNEPLPISVIVCKTESAAINHYKSAQNSPNLDFPTKNGHLVLFLSHWEKSEITTNVLAAFNTFSPAHNKTSNPTP